LVPLVQANIEHSIRNTSGEVLQLETLTFADSSNCPITLNVRHISMASV
jgi:hypothetical protein